MNYGMYLSAAGAQAFMYRQDVFSNNLANMNTVGFKPDVVMTRQRLPERLEDPTHFAEPQWMLEQLGGGLLANPTSTSTAQGELQASGSELDAAIVGRGFFVVGDGASTRPDALRFTRDGRFTLNAESELVLAANGTRVLDSNRRPITLAPGEPVRIDSSGTVHQGDRTVARLLVADVEQSDLEKAGDGAFRFVAGRARTPGAADGRVQQRFTESAAVDPIKTMNDMIAASKIASGNLRMMQYHDSLLGQVFSRFGRVS